MKHTCARLGAGPITSRSIIVASAEIVIFYTEILTGNLFCGVFSRVKRVQKATIQLFGPDHVQVFWKHMFLSVLETYLSQLETRPRPLIG